MKNKDKEKDKVFPIIKELFKFVRYPRILLVLIVAFIVVSNLCEIYFAVLIGQITQSVAAGKGLMLGEIWLPIAAATVIRLSTAFFHRRLLGGYQAAVQMQFSNHTLKKLMTSKQNWLENQKSGDLMDRSGESLQYGVSLLSESVPNLVYIFLSIIVMAVYLISNNWILALGYFLFYPPILMLQNTFSKPVRKVTDERFQQAARCGNLALDALRNLSTVKAYRLEEHMSEEYQSRTKQLRKRFFRFTFVKSLTGFLGDSVAILPIILVCIGAVIMVDRQMLQIGTFLSFMLVMIQISNPLSSFGRRMTTIRGNMAGAARMLELWHAPEEDRSQPITVPVEDQKAVCFENVSFAYNAEDPVLTQISFSIQKGEHIALVGESGCGKSTIIRLIGGLYNDYSGSIQVFGQPMQEWNPAALRNHLSFVTQNADLFPVSLYENVAWAGRDVTMEQVVEVCQYAGIHDFIQSLPEGYETLAGERGMQLSGGQKQRIAIARALLRNADLLILDEATSALDTVTERAVQAELEKLIEGKTAIIVGHRLSALRNVDRILVINQGRVAEEGTHVDLIARKGIYYTLYQKQQDDTTAQPQEVTACEAAVEMM